MKNAVLSTVYINDLPACNIFSKPRMHADDTKFTFSAEDPLVLERRMNYDMIQIQLWLSTNKLCLNVKKTKFMVIGSQENLSHIDKKF